MTAQQQGQCFRLLDLPPEIREHIYHLLSEKSTVEIGPGIPTDSTPHIPPIAQTCHILRYEALPSYFSTTSFIFKLLGDGPEFWFKWLNTQDDLAISSIRSMEVACYTIFTAHKRNGWRRHPEPKAPQWFHQHFFHVDVRKGIVEVLKRDESCVEWCRAMNAVAEELKKVTKMVEVVDGARRFNKGLLREMLLRVCEQESTSDKKKLVGRLRDPDFPGSSRQDLTS